MKEPETSTDLAPALTAVPKALLLLMEREPELITTLPVNAFEAPVTKRVPIPTLVRAREPEIKPERVKLLVEVESERPVPPRVLVTRVVLELKSVPEGSRERSPLVRENPLRLSEAEEPPLVPTTRVLSVFSALAAPKTKVPACTVVAPV